jgi:hypothetical protein
MSSSSGVPSVTENSVADVHQPAFSGLELCVP